MKAKRILSLLLTVAMVVACGLTAFATAPVEGYVQLDTTDLAGMDPEKISGVLPVESGEDAIQVRLSVTHMTDEEFVATYEGATPQDYGAKEGWVDSTYIVTIDLLNLGTLYHKKNSGLTTTYDGFKVVGANLKLSYGDDVVFAAEVGGELTGASVTDQPGYYQYVYSDGNPSTAYPSTNGTLADASVEGAAVALFFAKAGAELTLSNGFVMYNNFYKGTNTSGKYTDGTACPAASVALWGPATVTLGEAGGNDPDPVAPTFGANNVAGKADGVEVDGVNYDNAYAVKVEITPNDADEIGVLFIPEDVVTYYNDTNWTKAAKATIDGLGGGKTEFNAAIINIPRALEKIYLKMLAKAYAVLGENVTYGNVVEQTIFFTDTGLGN